MKWHGDCKYMELLREYSVEEFAKCHGHLGPFIVLGYHMGRYALNHFDNNPFALSAIVSCSGQPPESCLTDGVQIGSGCTYGKQNIELPISPEISAIFRHEDGRSILMKQGNYLSKQEWNIKADGDRCPSDCTIFSIIICCRVCHCSSNIAKVENNKRYRCS